MARITRREALKAMAGTGALLSAIQSGMEAQISPQPFPVTVRVNALQPMGELRAIWRFFGCDEPNYATLPNGKKLLSELGALMATEDGGRRTDGLRPFNLQPGCPAPSLVRGAGATINHSGVYFRAHNLLTSGEGTPALKWGSTNAYTEDAQGNPVYDWTILDSIFDAYLQRGLRPYAQIGFMPESLSTHPEPYRHRWTPRAKYDEIFTGWAYPPKDYGRWAELVFRWVTHCVEKYGRAEVERWYWEVWNEPNIGYWRGTPEEFHMLHDFAIDAVRRALPTARVGGPDVAGSGGRFMREFLDHCLHGVNYATGRPGTPLDFVSFHAKGAPEYAAGHVRMGIANELRTVDSGFSLIASYPELKDKPIVIGEADPDGCAACQGPQLAYRNGTLYPAYTAACFARIHDLADRHGVNLEGALTWAFEFEDQPYFAGFRALATNGIDLPIVNLFRMFSRMGGSRLAAESSAAIGLEAILRDGVRGAPDVSALACLEGRWLSVLVWHYHDDDLPGPGAAVELTIQGLPATGNARLRHYRIDQEHSDAYTLWQRLGAPQSPSAEQFRRLERAGRLASLHAPSRVHVEDGRARIPFTLPRQAISLIVIEA